MWRHWIWKYHSSVDGSGKISFNQEDRKLSMLMTNPGCHHWRCWRWCLLLAMMNIAIQTGQHYSHSPSSSKEFKDHDDHHHRQPKFAWESTASVKPLPTQSRKGAVRRALATVCKSTPLLKNIFDDPNSDSAPVLPTINEYSDNPFFRHLEEVSSFIDTDSPRAGTSMASVHPDSP